MSSFRMITCGSYAIFFCDLEQRKLERARLASEFAAPIGFSESWQWFGPGVIAGVELDAFIGSNKSRLSLYFCRY